MLRKFLNEINDQDRLRRQQTDTKQQDTTIEDLLRQRQHHDVDHVRPTERPINVPPQRLSREETLAKLRDVHPSEEMMRKLGQIDQTMQDEISDDEARANAGVRTSGDVEPVEVKPNTIPKIINKELQATGQILPQWHMVKNLPGYLAAPIRSIGRSVFKPFTRTSLEEIQVIANLMGQGPNHERELSAVAQHLMKHARRDRDAEIVFHGKIPDYGADVKVFKDGGITYLLVKDFAGHYIYAWPSDDEHKKLDNIPSLAQESVEQGKKKMSARAMLNQAIVTKKAGGHYSEKLDYKRSKEKQKFRKEVKDV